MKKPSLWITLVLAVVCLIGFVLLPTEAKAAEELASGNCGSDVTWTLTDDGVLTISGEGKMMGYGSGSTPWYDYREQITSAVIEDGVTNIGSYAFYNCYYLSSVSIGADVTEIKSHAFGYCGSLTEVSLPQGVTAIHERAFYNCQSLICVNIPDGVKEIGMAAFKNCSSLVSVTIPNSVWRINKYAFEGCSSLVSADLGTGVTQMDDWVFASCSSLTDIVIPEKVTSIGKYSFYQCSSLKSVTIHDGVTSIGNCAFEGCSSLTDISIPDSVTELGSYTFKSCGDLVTVTLGDGITILDRYVFSGCSSLTHMTIPDGVRKIHDGAFEGCSSLTSVTIPQSIYSISGFSECSNLRHVLYKGTESEWNEIKISIFDEALTDAIRHYNCTGDEIVNGVCTICKENCTHKWDDVKITKAATCTEDGTQVLTCTTCGESKEEIIVAKGHTEVIDEAVTATCTTSGLTEGKHCSVCQIVLVAQSVVPAKSHSDGDNDFACDACGINLCASHTEVVIPGTEATCEQSGLTAGKKCANCGEILEEQEAIPALGHSWVEASCEFAKTCTTCGKTEGEALGHNYDDWTEVITPTTEAAGLEERVCISCGNKEQRELAKLEPNTTEPNPTGSDPTEPPTTSSTAPEQTMPSSGNGTEKAQKYDNSVVVIVVLAVVVVGGVAALVVLKRKIT